MRSFHQQGYTVMRMVWLVSILGCCEAFFATTTRQPLSTSCSTRVMMRKTIITTKTRKTTTTIHPRARDNTMGNTMGSSWCLRLAIDKDVSLPSSHHPPQPLVRLLLRLLRVPTRVSSWIRPKWKRCLATATLVLYTLFLHSPSWVHASSGNTLEAVKVERIILEPAPPDGILLTPRTNEPKSHDGSAAVTPLITGLIGAGASAMALRTVRRHRVSTNRTSSSTTGSTRDNPTHPPLDHEDKSTTKLEGQGTTMLLCPPPGGIESLLSAAQEEVTKDMATPTTPTTTTTTTTTTTATATSPTSAGVFLEHDPDIEPEIHDSLDRDKEGTFLYQPARNIEYPLRDSQFREARRQPKSQEEKERWALKYARIDNVSERAYQVLLDLGMIEQSRPTVDMMSKFDGIIDTNKKE